MASDIKVMCTDCNGSFKMPYILLGTTVECPSCGKRSLPNVVPGILFPNTGYQLTFKDFRQLLTKPECKARMGSYLEDWYGYEIMLDSEPSCVVDERRKQVDLLELHLSIQKNPVKQQMVYRVAMALWR